MGAACIQPIGSSAHGSLVGLTVDHHSQYALLDGRSGGQQLTGGDAASEQLTLESTSHATKGGVKVAAGDWLIVPEVAAPATPATGFGAIYEKTDGKLYFKNDGGTEYDLTTGITTHDLLSASHGDTLAAAVQAGDIIVGNATPKWSRLAAGSESHVLTIVAGVPTWAAPGSAAFTVTSDVIGKTTDSNQVILEATGADEVQLGVTRGAAGTTANILEVYEEDGSTLIAAVKGDGSLYTKQELNFNGTTFLSGDDADTLLLGREVVDSAGIAQTIQAAAGVGNNKAGGDLTLLAGPGTGTGSGGHFIVQVAPPSGTPGAGENLPVDRLTVLDDSATFYLGDGITSADPDDVTVQATGGTGTNVDGADLDLVGGAPTGNAQGGDVAARTAPSGSSGTTPQVPNDRFFVRAQQKTLADNVQADVFTILLPPAGRIGGQIFYTVRCTDDTDYQAVSGVVTFAAVNKGGTFTVDLDQPAGNQSDALSTGTLAVTWAIADNGVDIILRITANSSLTPTGLDLFYTVILNGVGDITPA